MASPKRSMTIGPFVKGLNTFSDPSAVPDDGLAELLNMELDLDGSLMSRPPFHDTGINMPLQVSGNMVILGFYYTPLGAEYLIGTDGVPHRARRFTRNRSFICTLRPPRVAAGRGTMLVHTCG